MIFTAWQLQEKCCEQRQLLYMAFIDLTKAFDMVDHQALWSIQSMYGCHDKYIRILRLLYDSMEVTVLSNGSTKSVFHCLLQWKRVKQGCIIAPTVFAIFIAASLAKSCYRGFQSCIELMVDSSTLTGLRPRVKSTAPQLQSYSTRTIMLSPQKTSRAF